MSARPRNAVVVAAILKVLCPFCRCPQPTDRGFSFLWEPDEVRRASGLDRNCVVCGEPFILIHSNRVNVK